MASARLLSANERDRWARERVIFLVMIFLVAIRAQRNLTRRRCDVRETIRLAIFAFALRWVIVHPPSDHAVSVEAEMRLIVQSLVRATCVATVWSMPYVALEPIVRRFWPEMLIPWTRLLSGKRVDPLVGRDLLVGSLAGFALFTIVPLLVSFDLAPSQGYRSRRVERSSTRLEQLSDSGSISVWWPASFRESFACFLAGGVSPPVPSPDESVRFSSR